MCGRFTLASQVSDLRELINFAPETMPGELPLRFNIAPTQPVLAFRSDVNSLNPVPALFQWGLVPFWAKDITIGPKLINARSETVNEKPSFRAAFKYRRCIIPVDGFYEWRKASDTGKKIPWWIHRPDRKPFALAGLWESWDKDGSGPLETCTILTTHANAFLEMLHERMPVIIEPENIQKWLYTSSADTWPLYSLFNPVPDDFLKAWPVSTRVNSPLVDDPELITPLAEA